MPKAIKTIIWIVVIALVTWGICTLLSREKSEISQIKIGAPLILSGDGAFWGENAKRGIEMAVNEFLDKNSELDIEIVYEDTQGEISKAVSAFQKLSNVDNVDAMIGPLFQSEVAAISPIAFKNNIPVITPSYAPIENRSNPRNPLMIWMNPTIEAERIAEFVYKKEGVKKVSILGTQDSWEKEVSNAFANKFKELGGEVTAKELVQTDVSDVRATITKLLRSNPEGIYLGTYYQFIQGLRVIKERGYEGKIYSIEVDSYLADETKQFSNGLKFISPESYRSNFITKFETKYNQKPGIPAGQAYDATNILLSFLEETQDKIEIINMMENLNEYEGVSGNIIITEDNTTLFPTAIYELKNGESTKISD